MQVETGKNAGSYAAAHARRSILERRSSSGMSPGLASPEIQPIQPQGPELGERGQRQVLAEPTTVPVPGQRWSASIRSPRLASPQSPQPLGSQAFGGAATVRCKPTFVPHSELKQAGACTPTVILYDVHQGR